MQGTVNHPKRTAAGRLRQRRQTRPFQSFNVKGLNGFGVAPICATPPATISKSPFLSKPHLPPVRASPHPRFPNAQGARHNAKRGRFHPPRRLHKRCHRQKTGMACRACGKAGNSIQMALCGVYIQTSTTCRRLPGRARRSRKAGHFPPLSKTAKAGRHRRQGTPAIVFGVVKLEELTQSLSRCAAHHIEPSSTAAQPHQKQPPANWSHRANRQKPAR